MRRPALLALILAALGARAWAQPSATAQPAPAAAAEARRGVLIAAPAVPETTVDAVERSLGGRGIPIERANPAAPPAPPAEATLADVRPLYRDLRLREAQSRLEAAEAAVIADRLPSVMLERSLAELELWRGSLSLLEHDSAGALERFHLAQRLSPTARPDRIFPPEVLTAFTQARAAVPHVSVALKVAPVGARVWLDGHLLDAGPAPAALGLHHVVVERADRRPVARLWRLVRAAPEIAANLSEPATATQAVAQAAARLDLGSLGRDEAIGVSAVLGRPLWVLSTADGKLTLERYDAADTTRPSASLSAGDADKLGQTACVLEARCAPEAIPTGPTEGPKKPVWKRAWFWGVVGAAVLAAVGAATGAGVAATAPRDYVVRVR